MKKAHKDSDGQKAFSVHRLFEELQSKVPIEQPTTGELMWESVLLNVEDGINSFGSSVRTLDTAHSTTGESVQLSLQNVLRHQCTSCGYTSNRYADLKSHIRIHTGERPYLCTICAKSFNERAT
ncbi:hypothetical protein CEXT_98251 [Caerostris extrusa]|uniref:C2H2-type domain-containing protein n=1 Tax=Caerostris extrusa TaxID=172846 RepID=A0AAV4PIN9_CAEEX|nr:hypothetical protein CEXT_98251 [Caerostris extrusa]